MIFVMFFSRKETFVCLAEEDKRFCHTCGLLLLPKEAEKSHSDHHISSHVQDISTPTLWLQPISNNKTNAVRMRRLFNHI